MSYKAQPIYEGGSVANSMAALCRQFNIDPDYIKLEVSYSEHRALYHLWGRASALFSFDEKAATYEAVETKVARVLEQWRTHGVDNDATPESEAHVAQGSQELATKAQKEEIIRLLAHPLITRQERTKLFLVINKITGAVATQKIAKLRKAIEGRADIRVAA